jgi:hypothetical protein
MVRFLQRLVAAEPTAAEIAAEAKKAQAARELAMQEERAAREWERRQEEELAERIAASHAALVAELARNGYTDVGFGSGPGGTRDERVDRIFREWS